MSAGSGSSSQQRQLGRPMSRLNARRSYVAIAPRLAWSGGASSSSCPSSPTMQQVHQDAGWPGWELAKTQPAARCYLWKARPLHCKRGLVCCQGHSPFPTIHTPFVHPLRPHAEAEAYFRAHPLLVARRVAKVGAYVLRFATALLSAQVDATIMGVRTPPGVRLCLRGCCLLWGCLQC